MYKISSMQAFMKEVIKNANFLFVMPLSNVYEVTEGNERKNMEILF